MGVDRVSPLPREHATGSTGGADVVLAARCAVGTGLGHVVRCGAIAREVVALGLRATVAVEDPEPLSDVQRRRIDEAGAQLVAWGTGGLRPLVDRLQPACVVLDDPTAPVSLDAELREERLLVVLDGSATRVRAADIVVDSTYSADPAAKWAGLLGDDALLLAGPRYAPIDSRFAVLLADRRDPPPIPLRVAVALGGDDYTAVVRTVLQGLASAPELVEQVDVVVGSMWAPTFAAGQVLPAGGGIGVRFHLDPPDPGAILAAADVAVGAMGMMAWERAFLGVPSLTLSVVDHQAAIAHALESTGAIEHLGTADALDANRVSAAFAALAVDRERRVRMADAARRLFDCAVETGATAVARAIADRIGGAARARPAAVRR